MDETREAGRVILAGPCAGCGSLSWGWRTADACSECAPLRDTRWDYCLCCGADCIPTEDGACERCAKGECDNCRGARAETCGGDRLVVVGWDEDAYENIEGPCPGCPDCAEVDP